MINAYIIGCYWLAIPLLIILGVLYAPVLIVFGLLALGVLFTIAAIRAEIQDRQSER